MAKEGIRAENFANDVIDYSINQLALSAMLLAGFAKNIWKEVGPPIERVAAKKVGNATEQVVFQYQRKRHAIRPKQKLEFTHVGN